MSDSRRITAHRKLDSKYEPLITGLNKSSNVAAWLMAQSLLSDWGREKEAIDHRFSIKPAK